MESLLRLSGMLGEDNAADGRTEPGSLERRVSSESRAVHHSGLSSNVATPTPPTNPREAPGDGSTACQTPTAEATSEVPAMSATQTVDNQPVSKQPAFVPTSNARYLGSTTGFSIFSARGIQWVNEKMGDTSYRDAIVRSSAVDDKAFRADVFDDIFKRRTYHALPPKAEAYALLREYFGTFNTCLPLYHEATFMAAFERHYALNPDEGPGSWASLNIVLAIAYRMQSTAEDCRSNTDKAWMYAKNALASQTELSMRGNDLWSVQALLGMAVFLRCSPDPNASYSLIATAIRLAHGIGLHIKSSEQNMDPVEREQRNRVFWYAYFMDKDICLRAGRPPIQDDGDMDIDLPDEFSHDGAGSVPLGKGKTINLFRLHCIFAMIQSKVYKQLYSVKASRQSDSELLNAIGSLDAELDEWKNAIPIQVRPGREVKVTDEALFLPFAILHFAYHNCLTMIHRMSVHLGYWSSRVSSSRVSSSAVTGLTSRPANPRVFESAAIIVDAARATIALLKHISPSDNICSW